MRWKWNQEVDGMKHDEEGAEERRRRGGSPPRAWTWMLQLVRRSVIDVEAVYAVSEEVQGQIDAQILLQIKELGMKAHVTAEEVVTVVK